MPQCFLLHTSYKKHLMRYYVKCLEGSLVVCTQFIYTLLHTISSSFHNNSNNHYNNYKSNRCSFLEASTTSRYAATEVHFSTPIPPGPTISVHSSLASYCQKLQLCLRASADLQEAAHPSQGRPQVLESQAPQQRVLLSQQNDKWRSFFT